MANRRNKQNLTWGSNSQTRILKDRKSRFKTHKNHYLPQVFIYPVCLIFFTSQNNSAVYYSKSNCKLNPLINSREQNSTMGFKPGSHVSVCIPKFLRLSSKKSIKASPTSGAMRPELDKSWLTEIWVRQTQQ